MKFYLVDDAVEKGKNGKNEMFLKIRDHKL